MFAHHRGLCSCATVRVGRHVPSIVDRGEVSEVFDTVAANPRRLTPPLSFAQLVGATRGAQTAAAADLERTRRLAPMGAPNEGRSYPSRWGYFGCAPPRAKMATSTEKPRGMRSIPPRVDTRKPTLLGKRVLEFLHEALAIAPPASLAARMTKVPGHAFEFAQRQAFTIAPADDCLRPVQRAELVTALATSRSSRSGSTRANQRYRIRPDPSVRLIPVFARLHPTASLPVLQRAWLSSRLAFMLRRCEREGSCLWRESGSPCGSRGLSRADNRPSLARRRTSRYAAPPGDPKRGSS